MQTRKKIRWRRPKKRVIGGVKRKVDNENNSSAAAVSTPVTRSQTRPPPPRTSARVHLPPARLTYNRTPVLQGRASKRRVIQQRRPVAQQRLTQAQQREIRDRQRLFINYAIQHFVSLLLQHAPRRRVTAPRRRPVVALPAAAAALPAVEEQPLWRRIVSLRFIGDAWNQISAYVTRLIGTKLRIRSEQCNWPQIQDPTKRKQYVLMWIADIIHDFYGGLNTNNVDDIAYRARYFLYKTVCNAFSQPIRQFDPINEHREITNVINNILVQQIQYQISVSNIEDNIVHYFATVEPLRQFERHIYCTYDEFLSKTDAEIDTLVKTGDILTLRNDANHTYKQIIGLTSDANYVNPQRYANRVKITERILRFINNNNESLQHQPPTYFTFDAHPIIIRKIIQNTSPNVKGLFTPQTFADSSKRKETIQIAPQGDSDSYSFTADSSTPTVYTSKCLNYRMDGGYQPEDDFHIKYENNAFGPTNRYGFTYVLYKNGLGDVKMPFSTATKHGPSQSYLCDLQDKIVRSTTTSFPSGDTSDHFMNSIHTFLQDPRNQRFAQEVMKEVRTKSNPVLMKIKQAGDQDQITSAVAQKRLHQSVVLVTHDRLCALNARLNCLNTIYEEKNGTLVIYRVSEIDPAAARRREEERVEAERQRQYEMLGEKYQEIYNAFGDPARLTYGLITHCNKFKSIALDDKKREELLDAILPEPVADDENMSYVLKQVFTIWANDIALKIVHIANIIGQIQARVIEENLRSKETILGWSDGEDTAQKREAISVYYHTIITRYTTALQELGNGLEYAECLEQCRVFLEDSLPNNVEQYFFLHIDVEQFCLLHQSIIDMQAENNRVTRLRQEAEEQAARLGQDVRFMRSLASNYTDDIIVYNESIDNIFDDLYNKDIDGLIEIHNRCKINSIADQHISELMNHGIVGNQYDPDIVRTLDEFCQEMKEHTRVQMEDNPWLQNQDGGGDFNKTQNVNLPKMYSQRDHMMELCSMASIYLVTTFLHPVDKDNHPIPIPTIISNIEKADLYHRMSQVPDVILEDLTNDEQIEIKEYIYRVMTENDERIHLEFSELRKECYYSDVVIHTKREDQYKYILPVFNDNGLEQHIQMTNTIYQFYVLVALAYINEKMEGRRYSILSNFFITMSEDYPLLFFIKTEIDNITAEKNAQSISFQEWFRLFTDIHTKLVKEIPVKDLPTFTNQIRNNTYTPIKIPIPIQRPTPIRSKIERPSSLLRVMGGKRFRCTKRKYRPTKRHLTQKNLTK